MAEVKIRGGDKVGAYLTKIRERLSRPASLRVGFLANATYPSGQPVAMIAAIHEWGAPNAGIPPRPFFRPMVADKQGEWAPAIAALLPQNGYDVAATLDQAGFAIAGQLRQSIVDVTEPPLAPSTIARKGFDKPLVDTGHMLNSVDHEVVESKPS